MPSVLWRCWLGSRKGIRPVKNWVVGCWRGYLEWGADLHITQQMPLPLTISCSSKSRLVLPSWFLPFWYLLTQMVPDKFQKSSKTVVCVCVFWQRKTPNLPFLDFSILWCCQIAVYEESWMHVHNYKPSSINAIKIVFILQWIHGKIVRTNFFSVKSETDKQIWHATVVQWSYLQA